MDCRCDPLSYLNNILLDGTGLEDISDTEEGLEDISDNEEGLEDISDTEEGLEDMEFFEGAFLAEYMWEDRFKEVIPLSQIKVDATPREEPVHIDAMEDDVVKMLRGKIAAMNSFLYHRSMLNLIQQKKEPVHIDASEEYILKMECGKIAAMNSFLFHRLKLNLLQQKKEPVHIYEKEDEIVKMELAE